MNIPTHQQLMLGEISASVALQLEHIANERDEVARLIKAGFPTQAFLHLWIVTEVAAKELMCIYKYTKDTHAAIKKVHLELKRAVQPHLDVVSKEQAHSLADAVVDKTLPSLINPFHSLFKSGAETTCRKLDVGIIKSALIVLDLAVEEAHLNYLLATKVNELPVGIKLTDKTTIRERRNKLVHTNGQVVDSTLTQLLTIFDYFFALLQSIGFPPAVSQQQNSDKEVAE